MGHGREAEFTNAIQKWVKENTRLGIPVIFHEEALHGLMGQEATSFPRAIALASTWNPDLVERVFATVAREVRARGRKQVLAPVVDVARDPRWGASKRPTARTRTLWPGWAWRRCAGSRAAAERSRPLPDHGGCKFRRGEVSRAGGSGPVGPLTRPSPYNQAWLRRTGSTGVKASGAG